MKRKLLKHINYILGIIVGLLGFQSCDSIGGSGVEEYGCPHAEFALKGKVTDVNGNPIAGEEILTQTTDGQDIHYWDEERKVLTDNAGQYIIEQTVSFAPPRVRVIVVDNTGKYQNDTVKIYLQQTKKGEGWFDGRFEGSADFVLKEKQESLDAEQ